MSHYYVDSFLGRERASICPHVDEPEQETDRSHTSSSVENKHPNIITLTSILLMN